MTGRLRAPTGRYGGKTAEERQAERRRRFLDAALQLFGDTPATAPRPSRPSARPRASPPVSSTRSSAPSRTSWPSCTSRSTTGRRVPCWPRWPTRTGCRSQSARPRSSAPTRRTSPPIRGECASRSWRSSASVRGWRSSGWPVGRSGSIWCAPRRTGPWSGGGGPAGLSARRDRVHRQCERAAARLERGVGGRDPGRGRGGVGAAVAGDSAAARVGVRSRVRTGAQVTTAPQARCCQLPSRFTAATTGAAPSSARMCAPTVRARS